MQDAPVPNWRDADPDSATPSGMRAWQGGGAAPTETSGLPSKRFVKRALAAFFLVAFAVGIGVLLYMLRKTPPSCLVLVGSGYEKNLLLPHNVYGWNGLKKLEEVADHGGFFRGGLANWFSQPSKVRLTGDRLELNKEVGWKEAWKKILKQIDAPDAEKTVVLAISMHGMADGDEVYLLRNVPDVQALDDFKQSRIPFREVLDNLKKPLKDKKIVLLLDVCHVQAHWPIGMLQNDFVATLKKTYEKEIAGLDNLTVICSSGPDQISWASEELQTTLFAHYVAQALAGVGRPDNDDVTAASLFNDVAENVKKRAEIERAREQNPVLLGGETHERLAGEVSLVHVETPPPVKPREARPFSESERADLQTEWESWRTLKKEQAPHVYCPHLWRLYQETLLRYEQLVRAGDPTDKAKDLKTSLSALHEEIVKAKALKAAFMCVGNDFPIHRVLGYPTKGDVTDDALWDYYQSDPRAIDPDKTKQLLGPYSIGDDKSRYMLARVSQLVWDNKLRQADDFNPAADRKRLAEIAKDLQLTGDKSHCPVEVQLLKMLEDSTLDAETIKLALKVRRAAEETALSVPSNTERAEQRSELYAEVIFQRVQEKVENADAQRRKGEDFLFGNARLHAKEAQAKLKDAEAIYEDARGDANQLRRALALRDELSADLPFLAAWLAALPTRAGDSVERLREDAVTLGDKLAALNRNLRNEQLVPTRDDVDVVQSLFGNTLKEHRLICEKLDEQGQAKLQQDWHAIDAALLIPPVDVYAKTDVVKLRIGLLAAQRKISGDLHVEKALGARTESESPKDRLDRNRKLLRACLTPYADFQDERLADQTREFLFKLPTDIKAADGVDEEKKLLAAVTWCRIVPGALADAIKQEKKPEEHVNPAGRLRRLRTGELLLWLGQRTLDDHWFDAPDHTYYGPTAKAYFDSAQSLLGKELPKELIARQAMAGLSIVNPPNPYWTSERVFPLDWHVQADAPVPEGMPMVWLEVKPKAGKAWQPEERKALAPWPRDKKPYLASFRLRDNEPVGQGDLITLHTVYRGQHKIDAFPLQKPPPNLIIHHPPARDTVSFACRMDSRFNYGAISIILDNSGSMRTLHPKKNPKDADRDAKEGEDSRLDYARKAMQEVLKRIPDDTDLSIFAFGGKEKTEPIAVRSVSAWNQGELKALMAELKGLGTDNFSPITEAIKKSMKEGFRPDFDGPKVIVVLTDGMDNTYFKNDDDGNTKMVQDELRKAYKIFPEVDVAVVCFIDPLDKEFPYAERQFDRVTPKTRFIPQARGEALKDTIEEIIRPRVELKLGAQVAPGFLGGRPVNFHTDELLDWGKPIPAENYDAIILRTKANRFEAKMPPGHDLFTILKRSRYMLSLERGIVGRQKEVIDAGGVSHEQKGWLATLLHNNVGFDGHKLSQLVSFEKLAVEDPTVLQQTHPGFVWMELPETKYQELNRTLVWGKEWSAPAAAFRLTMDDCPRANPKVAAWFWPENRGSFITIHPDRPKMVSQREEPVNDEGSLLLLKKPSAKLPIESVIWEEGKEIDMPSGQKQKKDCIVVRFRYEKERPIFVDLIKDSEGRSSGAVHMYYLEAGKGTACFFGHLRPETVKLALIDIDEFKKAAAHVVFAPDRTIKAPTNFVRE